MAFSAGGIVGNCAAVQKLFAKSVKNFKVETFVLLFGVDFVSTKILFKKINTKHEKGKNLKENLLKNGQHL